MKVLSRPVTCSLRQEGQVGSRAAVWVRGECQHGALLGPVSRRTVSVRLQGTGAS